MKRKYTGLIIIVIGILITLWGIFGETIAIILMPILGVFMILIGITFFIKMKKWYWLIIILITVIILYYIFVLSVELTIPA